MKFLPECHWIPSIEPHRLALMPRPRAGEWLEDEIAAWRTAGIGTVVSMLEAHEVRELGLGGERALCEAAGIELLSHPVPDRGVPRSVPELASLVGHLVSRVRDGAPVAIHCRAGIGRSGLLCACVLVELGVSPEEVFPLLSRARGVSVPDTAAQAEWVVQRFLPFMNQLRRRDPG